MNSKCWTSSGDRRCHSAAVARHAVMQLDNTMKVCGNCCDDSFCDTNSNFLPALCIMGLVLDITSQYPSVIQCSYHSNASSQNILLSYETILMCIGDTDESCGIEIQLHSGIDGILEEYHTQLLKNCALYHNMALYDFDEASFGLIINYIWLCVMYRDCH